MPASKKVTYNLDAELHQHLRVAAATERREMVELVEEALKSYFGWNRMTETESKELKTYELVEFRGKGQNTNLDFQGYSRALGCEGSEQAIAADLLHYMEQEGRLAISVYDGTGYRALQSFPNSDCLYVHGGGMRLKLTIPGRMRYEQLRQRYLAEGTQATLSVVPASGEPADPLIDQLKRLIAEPTHPLKLHDFLTPIVDEARAKIEGSDLFDYGTHPTQQRLVERVAIADEATATLVQLFAVGCHWADAAQAKLFSKALSHLVITPNPAGAFYSMWENVARYPALRLLYAGGVAACANDLFDVLRILMIETKSRPRPNQPELELVRLLHRGAEFFHDHWQWLPEMERRYVPVSDYLLKSLRIPLREIANSDEDLSEQFTRFEIFQSLIYRDVDQRDDTQSSWVPSGSFIYRGADLFGRLKSEIEHYGKDWKPLQAGLFSGSPERAKKLLNELEEFTRRVRNQKGIF
jgi:hypothetical protein